MRSSHHTLSFIVPFLNEASNLPRLLSALDQFARTAAQARNLEVDVIFVDDGSSDGGRDVITACVCTNLIRPKVRLVRLSRNFGKEIALSVGLKAAASDAVVLMDADLQHPVALVEQFLDGWLNDGYDVVYAYKQTNEDEATLRRLGRRLYYRMVNSNAGPEIPLNAGDFRLLSRRAYEALRELPERQRLMECRVRHGAHDTEQPKVDEHDGRKEQT